MGQIHMKQDKLLNNRDGKVYKYNSGNSKSKYCSKCLGLLGDERVRDNENNEFCDEKCRREFRLERYQDMDDILSNFR